MAEAEPGSTRWLNDDALLLASMEEEEGRSDMSTWAGKTAFINFSPGFKRKYVSKATLNVYLRRPIWMPTTERIQVNVEVFERFPNGSLGSKIASKHGHVYGESELTQVMVLLEELDVQQWLQQRSVVGLHVLAEHNGDNLVIYPGEGREDVMFLELELYDIYEGKGRQRRNKGSTNVCQPGQNQTGCCLYDLPIDFTTLPGWQYIIAPKRFNAYVCSGECSPVQVWREWKPT